MRQAHSAAQSPASRRRRLAHLIVLRRDRGHQMVAARSRSVCGPRLHQETAYGIIRRSARLDVAVFSPPFHSRKWAALALAINRLSNGPHPSSNFRPLLAGAAHRPTRQGKISEELNKGACSDDLTVALHATAALTAVSGALVVVFEEGEAPLRSHTVTERARAFQACQSTTFPEHQKRAAAGLGS